MKMYANNGAVKSLKQIEAEKRKEKMNQRQKDNLDANAETIIRGAMNTTEAKHSALPWKQHHPSYYAEDGRQIEATKKEIDGSTEIIASYLSPTNAAYIVQVCNSHEQLLEACKVVLESHFNLYKKCFGENSDPEIDVVRKQLNTALRNAERGADEGGI